jgi:hypothetical protein
VRIPKCSHIKPHNNLQHSNFSAPRSQSFRVAAIINSPKDWAGF